MTSRPPHEFGAHQSLQPPQSTAASSLRILEWLPFAPPPWTPRRPTLLPRLPWPRARSVDLPASRRRGRPSCSLLQVLALPMPAPPLSPPRSARQTSLRREPGAQLGESPRVRSVAARSACNTDEVRAWRTPRQISAVLLENDVAAPATALGKKGGPGGGRAGRKQKPSLAITLPSSTPVRGGKRDGNWFGG